MAPSGMDDAVLIAARRARFGAVAILLWDYAITFGEEVDYVGGSRWTIAKALFIWNRYFGIIRGLADMAIFFKDNKSDLVSDFGFRWQYIAGTFSILTVEIILQLRLYAMYNRNKKLMLVTGMLCLTEIVTVFALIGKSLVAMDVSATGKIECCTLPHAAFFGGYWGPILGFETFLFGLALYKGYMNGVGRGDITQSPGSQLMQSLVQHSIVYFLIIFSVFLLNFIVPFIIPLKVEYFIEFAFTLSSVMGSRILLGIRQASNEPGNGRQTVEDTVRSTHMISSSHPSGRISPDGSIGTRNEKTQSLTSHDFGAMAEHISPQVFIQTETHHSY